MNWCEWRSARGREGEREGGSEGGREGGRDAVVLTGGRLTLSFHWLFHHWLFHYEGRARERGWEGRRKGREHGCLSSYTSNMSLIILSLIMYVPDHVSINQHGMRKSEYRAEEKKKKKDQVYRGGARTWLLFFFHHQLLPLFHPQPQLFHQPLPPLLYLLFHPHPQLFHAPLLLLFHPQPQLFHHPLSHPQVSCTEGRKEGGKVGVRG